MSTRLRSIFLVSSIVVLAAIGWVLVPPRPAADLGTWRVVVLQSDDWGMEGWFPDAAAADTLGDLVRDLPERLQAYGRGGLETAADVEAIAALLGARRDADGLPFVLQANHILAAPTVSAEGPEGSDLGWPVHAAGESAGRYARAGLREAVDAAIARGVWWPELHGLTHFDLPAYARARADADPVALRARVHDTFAHDGWLRRTELDGDDPERALRIAREAVERFTQRFGRAPTSVIAPDYRWGSEDERAWVEVGIEVVQAKREQIDRRLRPHTRTGRLLKWVRQRWQARTGDLHPLDRPAHLEPYGDPDPAAPQGAIEAAAAVRAAWAAGQPGVISVHRIQLVAFEEERARAGRAQLLRCLDLLAADGPVRCLVDIEVAQLQKRGWSRLDRGPWTVVRNFTDPPVELPAGTADEVLSFGPGTHTLLRGTAPAPLVRP